MSLLGRVYNSLPKSLKMFFSPFVIQKNLLKKQREIQGNVVSLEERHISNIQMLVDRDVLLSKLPLNAVGCEIGVDTGTYTEKIIATTQPQKLHLVDVWSSKRYPEKKFRGVKEKFQEEIATGKVEINRGYSTDVLPGFPNDYFDWVYLDSGHGFSLTWQELLLLRDKVKPGGIISGHDYCRYSHKGNIRFGVVEAVNKFCVEHDYEFLYLTMETHRHLSFAIRKI
jgi:hypothetical protein